MTIVPVEYPTQEDLDRLALLDAQHKRNVRIFKKVDSFVLVPLVLLFTACAVDGYIVNGAAGMLQAIVWVSMATVQLGFLIFASILMLGVLVGAVGPLLLMNFSGDTE